MNKIVVKGLEVMVETVCKKKKYLLLYKPNKKNNEK